MQVVEQAAVIEAPVDIVMEAVNDIDAIPDWATVNGSVEKTAGQGVGSRYDWYFQVGNFKFKGVLEVIEQTETSLITKSTGDVISIWTVNVTPLAKNRTAIRVVAEYTLPHAFVEPLVDIVLQRLATPEVAKQNMESFKGMVETRARVAGIEQALPGR